MSTPTDAPAAPAAGAAPEGRPELLPAVYTAPPAPAVPQLRDGWTEAQHQALDALDIPRIPSVRALLAETSRRTGLDVFARQLYVEERSRRIMTTIDGFRAVAEQHPDYAGQDGPYWCGPDGVWTDVWLWDRPPVAARVGIFRRGFAAPLYSVARYAEYVQMTKETRDRPSVPGPIWRKMPANQTAKCAEALALRRAFPMLLGGIYTAEEMAQAANDGPTPAAEDRPAAADREHAEPETDPAQRVAAFARDARKSVDVSRAWGNAYRAGALDNPVHAYDTGKRDTLAAYLKRRGEQLRAAETARAEATVQASGLPVVPSVPLLDPEAEERAVALAELLDAGAEHGWGRDSTAEWFAERFDVAMVDAGPELLRYGRDELIERAPRPVAGPDPVFAPDGADGFTPDDLPAHSAEYGTAVEGCLCPGCCGDTPDMWGFNGDWPPS